MAEVEIYTNKGCPACVNVKQYLDRKGIEYIEKKLGKSKKMLRNPKKLLAYSKKKYERNGYILEIPSRPNC